MTPLHPTSLTLFAEHCAHAVTLREQHTPYDRAIFGAGIAAHACLEACGLNPTADREKVCDVVVNKLASSGRSYDGVPEPPLPLEECIEGRRLALDWLLTHELPSDGLFEDGYAFDAAWRRVPYFDKSAVFRTILDVVETYEDGDEEWVFQVVEASDYKSAWPDREEALDSFQRHCQAVALWKAYPDAEIVRLSICNLRTGGTYTRDVDAHKEQDILAEWQKDIDIAIRALQGERHPIPGIRCLGCPYVLACDAAQDFLNRAGFGTGSVEEVAEDYAAARARADALLGAVKVACAKGYIATENGRVGYVPTTKRTPRVDAHQELWAKWSEKGDALGLLKAMGLSVSSIEKAAKVIFGKGRGVVGPRNEWVEGLVEEKMGATFKVEKS